MSARWRICILPCLHPNSDGSWTETILHSFNADGVDGYNPYANLILDKIGTFTERLTVAAVEAAWVVFFSPASMTDHLANPLRRTVG
jgi:hypothetical protein